MSEKSRVYAIHSDQECERLEVQAEIANIRGHLRHLDVRPDDVVLDIGCGSGSMPRTIAKAFPQANVTGTDLRQDYLDFAKARAATEYMQNLGFKQADIFALPRGRGLDQIRLTAAEGAGQGPSDRQIADRGHRPSPFSYAETACPSRTRQEL